MLTSTMMDQITEQLRAGDELAAAIDPTPCPIWCTGLAEADHVYQADPVAGGVYRNHSTAADGFEIYQDESRRDDVVTRRPAVLAVPVRDGLLEGQVVAFASEIVGWLGELQQINRAT